MKKFILLTILVGIFLTSCSENGNAEEQIIPTETSETRSVETVPESTAEESKITTVTTVSETTEISETTETSQATETPKPPRNYDVESVPYKAASIVYNEYLEFQNGQFEGWWVNDRDNDSPHVCTKILIFDMNGDGRQELISMKNSSYVLGYYTIYDLDSGEMLFNGYYETSDGKLYCKDGQYCLKFRGTRTMAYVEFAAEELENELPNAFEALGYNEDYFYMGNKVNAIIYEYENPTVSRTPYEGTEDSYCRNFSTTEGYTYYHGDYDTQIEQQERDFESNFEGCEEIGELWFIGEHFDNNVQVDGIFGIHLLQRHVNDFDALVERLSLYEE
ncbi:MAG: hypothetical protein K2J76_02825 [Oscillospiraceae bacterium]|nr:hypothetical protein [Oscillospiraceae bacterium]